MSYKKALTYNFSEIQNALLEILESIPEAKYAKKPFHPRFRSWQWEFSCILSTRDLYLQGILQKKLSPKETTCMTQEEAERLTKQEMKKALHASMREWEERIERMDETENISFFDEETPISNSLSWLLQHEQLHLGKLMLYCAHVNMPQSKTLQKMWGEDTFQTKQ